MGIESRRAARYPVNLDVDTKVIEKEGQFFSLAQGNSCRIKAVDVSILGLGVMCKFFLPRDLELNLDVNSRKGELERNIKVKGIIKHCRYIREFGYKCGIEFVSLSAADKEFIQDSFKDTEEKR